MKTKQKQYERGQNKAQNRGLFPGYGKAPLNFYGGYTMEKFTQKELKRLVGIGVAIDATENLPVGYQWFEKIGYSCGVYGINGGLLKDPENGKLYVIKKRNSNLFRCF